MSTRFMPNELRPSVRRTSLQGPLVSQSSRWTIVNPCLAVMAWSPVLLLRVVARRVPVDDDGGLVADHPGIVPARERGDIPRPGDEFSAVVHADREASTD